MTLPTESRTNPLCVLCGKRPANDSSTACLICDNFVRQYVGKDKAVTVENRGTDSVIRLVMKKLAVNRERAGYLLGLGKVER